MSLNDFSGVLWRERQLLELLLFKLEEEQLILTSGKTQWLGHATREVESVLEQIRGAELGRAVEADAAAREVGVPDGSNLLTIASHAPAPWREILTEHHRAFVELTEQVNELAEGNRELLATSSRAAQETLMSLAENVQTYDDRGATSAGMSAASLLDRAL